jgi:divalent metal cation (Fe/Co/Zn/Cd) transporter
MEGGVIAAGIFAGAIGFFLGYVAGIMNRPKDEEEKEIDKILKKKEIYN